MVRVVTKMERDGIAGSVVYHMNNAVSPIPFAPVSGKQVCTKFGTEHHAVCKGCSLRIQCVEKYLRGKGVRV